MDFAKILKGAPPGNKNAAGPHSGSVGWQPRKTIANGAANWGNKNPKAAQAYREKMSRQAEKERMAELAAARAARAAREKV